MIVARLANPSDRRVQHLSLGYVNFRHDHENQLKWTWFGICKSRQWVMGDGTAFWNQKINSAQPRLLREYHCNTKQTQTPPSTSTHTHTHTHTHTQYTRALEDRIINWIVVTPTTWLHNHLNQEIKKCVLVKSIQPRVRRFYYFKILACKIGLTMILVS